MSVRILSLMLHSYQDVFQCLEVLIVGCRCHCGAAKCQGYLEADSAQNRAALLMEADSGLDDAGYPLVVSCKLACMP